MHLPQAQRTEKSMAYTLDRGACEPHIHNPAELAQLELFSSAARPILLTPYHALLANVELILDFWQLTVLPNLSAQLSYRYGVVQAPFRLSISSPITRSHALLANVEPIVDFWRLTLLRNL